LHAAADALVGRSDGQLTLDGVSGTLLRPIHIEHAVLRNGRYEFTLDEATLRWSPFWLLTGVVAFDPVNVNRVRIVGGTASVEAGGELARIDLRSSIRAQSSAIEANAIVQPFAHPVIERAQAQLHAVDLRHFTEGTLAAVWDGTLDVAADGPIVHGKMAVTNNMPGAVDEGRVPLGTVAAAVQYADGGWDLTDVRVGLGPAGELSGGGTLKPHDVAVTLRGDAV